MLLKGESQHQDSKKSQKKKQQPKTSKQNSTADVADFTWKVEHRLSYRYKTTRQLHA